jgi:hypothetical protein
VVACLNCLGGVGFFLGGAAELLAHDYHGFINFNYVAGSALYSIASAFLLVMWQGNDFGGSLLNQLNQSMCAGSTVDVTSKGQDGVCVRVQRQRRHTLSVGASVVESLGRRLSLAPVNGTNLTESEGKKKTKLSLRGVLSLCIYCWLFVCTNVNFLIGIILHRSGERAFSEVAMTLVWILAVKLVLVVHSAITTVPNEQPYRFAMQSMWFLLVLAAAIQTLSLLITLPVIAKHQGHHIDTGMADIATISSSTNQHTSHGGEL